MRRALGIIRVSQRAGREGERFVSPADQEKRIRGACERDDLELLRVSEEIDVSGGAPLEKRPHLLEAVEAIEAGEAEVLVVAFFDRLVRSLRVQGEVVSRVEAAGGSVLAVDVGRVSEGSAGEWLSGTMLGAVAEYQRRTSAERSTAAQAAAVARGVAPFPHIPPGYRRGEDGRLVPAREARFIRKAFRMRSEGASIATIRAYLNERGIKGSYSSASRLLSNRAYLGEIHFGGLVNLEAHPPIVDRELWQRVQRVKVSRGRRPESERLLARLGVLRCGTCNRRMVIRGGGKRSPVSYRCPHTEPCPRRAAIKADWVERVVVDAVKQALAGVEGRASAEAHVREAERAADRAQEDFDAALRAFAGLEGEAAAVERLRELREGRDRAVEAVDQLGGAAGSITLTAEDWDLLTLEERRDLIRAVVERVTVAPGRGVERVNVELFV